jgi:hypothetical protein
VVKRKTALGGFPFIVHTPSALVLRGTGSDKASDLVKIYSKKLQPKKIQ